MQRDADPAFRSGKAALNDQVPQHHALDRAELANRSALFRYSFALVAAGFGYLIRIALVPIAHDQAPFLSFAPAVLLASAFGGFGPGVLATVASAALVFPTLSKFPELTAGEFVNTATFAVVGFGIAWLGGRLRRIGLHATQAARDLAAREAHLKSIVDTVPEAVIVIDEHGTIQSFSATAEELFGYAAAEMVGQNVRILMSPPDSDRHDEYIRNYLKTGQRHVIGIGRTVVARRKDGETFPVELAVGEMASGTKRFFTGFVRDLTEREATEARLRELQSELAHVSRLAAMGEMASTIAHELNQPLSAIANYLKGSLRLLGALADERTVPIQTALQASAEQALRAGQIIRRLRDFLGRQESDKRIESIKALVREAGALGLIGVQERGIRVRFQFAPQADMVLADKVQIQQVLLNLMRNAIEAMDGSERKELTIFTAAAEPGMVSVSVADTGSGIAPEISAQLFQAFATSKPHGMGIGLSISRNIINAHDGQITAEPNPGGGTVFRFTLRAVSADEVAAVE